MERNRLSPQAILAQNMPKKSMAGKRKREEAATSESPAKKPRKTQEKVSATELSDGTNHNAKLVK